MWLFGSLAVAGAVLVTGVLRWRRDDVRTGVALGTVAAGFAVLVGLVVDMLSSMA